MIYLKLDFILILAGLSLIQTYTYEYLSRSLNVLYVVYLYVYIINRITQ